MLPRAPPRLRQTGRVPDLTDGGAPARTRWVLHVDLDQFIAAVEVLRHPELAGRQVVVGGRGDPTERGVVSTASYEARALGVGSGMPLRIAARRAPEAVFLPVDHAAYDAASAEVMATLRAVPEVRVQVLGWDEAFVGATTDDPEALAHRLRQEVLDRTRLHCSVGIGDTTVRAKVATGFGKPRGVFRLTRENWLTVMGERPTVELWGVGRRISARLATLGITTVADLAGADPEVLAGEFGPRMGPWYRQLGRGEGAHEVDDTPWVARGHSRERTYQQDLVDRDRIQEEVRGLVSAVLDDVAVEGRPVVRVTLKVRYAPFFTRSYGRKIAVTHDRQRVTDAALALAERIDPDRPVRLLGVHAEMEMPPGSREGTTPTRSAW